MTITALAKQLKVSPMTVYRRCKKNGVSIDELRDGDGGELTQYGVELIASFFDNTSRQKDAQGDATDMPQRGATVATSANEGEKPDLETAAAVLQAKLDGANAMIEQLRAENGELRRQLDAVTAMLAAEQADRANERLLLSAGSPASDDGQQKRRGLFSFLRRK